MLEKHIYTYRVSIPRHDLPVYSSTNHRDALRGRHMAQFDLMIVNARQQKELLVTSH